MNPAVRAKLTPSTSSHLLDREALVTALAGGPPGAVRAVIAPAGWGKSSVLSQWMLSEHQPVAFVSFDRFDNDPARCWVHVLSAVCEAVSVDPESLLARLKLPGVSLVGDVVDPLLVLLGDRELLVVFDDLQSLSDAETLESLRAFIDGCPSTVDFGLGSRTEPPFGLERRRVNGDLIELRIEELSMSLDEAADVLHHSSGRSIGREHVEVLRARTEGWPAGLHLAGLSLRKRNPDIDVVARFAGDDRHLAAYLSSEVLAGLDDGDREFLLAIAVLDELDAGLCDAVRQAEDSGHRLTAAARTIQFIIPTTSVRGQYRFHQLFQEWLRDEAHRIDPSALRVGHRRAARAYADRNEPIAAMDHAQQAGDWRLAHELFTRFALGAIAEGNHATIARWCSRFPADLDPELLVAVKVTEAWERIFEGDVDAAERLCRTIERLVPGAKPTSEWAGDPGQVAVLRSFCHQTRGHLAAAHDEIEIARRHGVVPRIEVPLRFVAACTDYWQGTPDEGAFLEVATRAEEQHDMYAALLAYSYIAHIHLDMNDDAKARAWVDRIFATAAENDLSTFWYGSLALLARARVALTSADYGSALVDAEAAIALANQRSDVLAAFRSNLVLSETLHGDGNRAGARRHASLAAEIIRPLGEAEGLVEQLRVVERQLRLPPRKNAPRNPALPVDDLSDREMALLRLLPGELNQRELGAAMFVSFNTVKTYNRSIYRKLGVSSRDEAVAAARTAGLL